MGALIPPAIIDRIRMSNDIVEVIGSYLPLKRSGAGFFALCPFHKEKTPSFYVNPQRQIFHCFGCHKGGNVFTFIMEYENVPFIEAVKRLAERARIPIKFDDAPLVEKREKDLLYEIHEQITRRWHNFLLNESSGAVAREYLKQRGVTEEAVRIFRLGFAPESWDDTLNWGLSKGYSAELLEKAGLVIKKENSKDYYDRFRGRLMFPICDEQGRVVGFSGRILSGDEKTAKYVNSPETPIFIKSKIFYGLDKSKKAILDAGYAIVCEGQLDLISCYMGGIRNVVAPQGTAFTNEHSYLLKRYTDEVVLCFDSDNAGQEAAVRTAPILFSCGIAVRVAIIPEPDDPDSFIKRFGSEKFKELIENSKEFFDFYLDRLCKLNDPSTDKGKMVIVKEFGLTLKRTNNAVLIDIHKNRLANRLGVNRTAVDEEFKKLPSQKESVAAADEQIQDQKIAPPPKDELWLLKLVFLDEDSVQILNDYLDLNWIKDRRIKTILQKRMTCEKWLGVSQFIEEFDDPELAALISHSAIEEEQIPAVKKQVQDVILKLRNKFIDQSIIQIRMKLSDNNIDDATRTALLTEKINLDKAKLSPLQKLAEY